MSDVPPHRWLRRAEHLLAQDSSRLVLSGLILLSVIPSHTLESFYPFFFVVFALEFSLRTLVFSRNLRSTGWRWGEALMLFCDLLATLSFLMPVYRGTGLLRFLRLSRMVLLFGYWGNLARDVWFVLTRRERRYQFVFLFVAVAVLTVTSALVLYNLQPDGYDFDADGVHGRGDRHFPSLIFWSFRQVEDPGNLVGSLQDPLVVVISLGLTVCGLFLISFLIGIGTSSVADLMRLARNRPVRMSDHSVIVGLGAASEVLVSELQGIYAKNLKRARMAVLVPAHGESEFLQSPELRSVAYRVGNGSKVVHLRRVAAEQAKRAVFLTSTDRFAPDADAHVVSSVLALREINSGARIYAELRDERNLTAARLAGGSHTHVLASGRFLGYLMAQTIAFPGILAAYNELLTSESQEVYTYLFDRKERQKLQTRYGQQPGALEFRRLFRLARESGVLLLGVFASAAEPDTEVDNDSLVCCLNPLGSPAVLKPYEDRNGGVDARRLRGLIGLAARWEELAGCARALLAHKPIPEPAGVLPAAPAMCWGMQGEQLRKLTVLGINECLPVLLAELAYLYRGLEVNVVADKDSDVQTLQRRLRGLLDPESSYCLAPGTDLPMAEQDNTLRVGEPATVFRFLPSGHRDLSDVWSDLEAPALQADTFVFVSSEVEGVDPDAQLSLGVLRLADRYRRSKRDQPLRIVVEMQDGKKGELLERRLRGIFGEAAPPELLTVLPGEELKSRFVVQNLFVPGLNLVYEKLSAGFEQNFCRLLPSRPLSGPQRFGELVERFSQQGVLLLGFELKGPRIFLNPGKQAAERLFDGALLEAFYVLGDVHAFEGVAG